VSGGHRERRHRRRVYTVCCRRIHLYNRSDKFGLDGLIIKRGAHVAGLFFEQFEEGHLFVHALSRTVTESDNIWFSCMTMNPQPLHIDAEFAKTTEFGQPLVNSLFTLGLAIGMSVNDTTLGTTVANLGMREVTFPHPVFQGDTLRVETKVVSKRESRSRPEAGIVEFEHIAYKQNGEPVCRCLRAALMKKTVKKDAA
jgi:acyl dehydratase